MALKDWKKTSETIARIDWFNNIKSRGIILHSGWSGEKPYSVEILRLRPSFLRLKEYFFKSKSQALKFAKSYMRKH